MSLPWLPAPNPRLSPLAALEATKAIDPSKVVKANLPGSAANVGADQLIAFTKDRMGSMRAQRSVDFVASLPRSPVGKVPKRDLREQYWTGRTRGVS